MARASGGRGYDAPLWPGGRGYVAPLWPGGHGLMGFKRETVSPQALVGCVHLTPIRPCNGSTLVQCAAHFVQL
ncbi:unnamed protein product [Prunus armeniaca]|uniref:Uncharacterized protein n=1 Tax=Prunus armeniaca TaxID=36596 RepID=A0A6J5WT26_PRUAR|nr:unnamed protein product [Prunus armeniaca]